jgi:hypothetical protein
LRISEKGVYHEGHEGHEERDYSPQRRGGHRVRREEEFTTKVTKGESIHRRGVEVAEFGVFLEINPFVCFVHFAVNPHLCVRGVSAVRYPIYQARSMRTTRRCGAILL